MSHLLIQLVSTGGLLAVFLLMAGESAGLPISSEIVVPLGGALAARNVPGFTLLSVVMASSAGNLLGSLVAYLLTRSYGRAVILGPGRHLGLNAGHLHLAERFFDRFGLGAVFLGRLLPIVRTYISFPAGLSRKITPLPFSAATILGAVPWNLGLAYAGLKLGENYESVGKALGPFTLPLALLVLLVLAFAYVAGKRYVERGEEALADAIEPRPTGAAPR